MSDGFKKCRFKFMSRLFLGYYCNLKTFLSPNNGLK